MEVWHLTTYQQTKNKREKGRKEPKPQNTEKDWGAVWTAVTVTCMFSDLPWNGSDSGYVNPTLTWSLPARSRGRTRPIFKVGASIPEPAIDPADGRSPAPLPLPPCVLTTPSAFPTGGCSESSPQIQITAAMWSEYISLCIWVRWPQCRLKFDIPSKACVKVMSV